MLIADGNMNAPRILPQILSFEMLREGERVTAGWLNARDYNLDEFSFAHRYR